MMRSATSRRTGRERAIACVAAVALALCLVGLSSCGGSNDKAVVIRIGDQAITKATVDHWTRVIERGGAFGGFRGKPPRGTPKQRALALLVSSNWLIDEAARQGISVSESVIAEALTEREQGANFWRRLHATGQTVADLKLEMRAELAGESIREKLASGAAHSTPREIADFYRKNPQLFSTLEERVVELVENQPSASAATALVGRIGTGRQFSKISYHERVARTPGLMSTPEKVQLVNAIFAARPGVVSSPMLVNHHWAVFVVRGKVPARLQPFAKVRAEVVTRLDVTRQREVATMFDREYRSRWGAKTTCQSGYVAPGCPQSKGQLDAYEDPFSLRAHPLLSEQTTR